MMILDKAIIVTSEKETQGTVRIADGVITDVLFSDSSDYEFRRQKMLDEAPEAEILNLEGRWLMAGGIDAHVHFREPGLTHKADILTESSAAVAGGVTTVFDMPNTNPPTVTAEALKDKIAAAVGRSKVNIGFHFGATNENAGLIATLAESGDCETGISSTDLAGIKVFMGSSTGNMLVDEDKTLDTVFSIKGKPVLVHCEDEATIKANLQEAIGKYGDDIPFEQHEEIRSRKACIKSSIKALEKAMRFGTRLVLCHISTKEEIEMVRAAKINNPDIIAETSCNYLWFSNKDYSRLGSRVKCNPSVKKESDRQALRAAVAEGIIDTIGSDHAPHLMKEKETLYCKAPSGLPSIQQSLPVLLTIAEQEDIPLTRIAEVFSEKAADIYGLKRGKIKCGYAADIVIFDKDREFMVRNEDQYSKCGWTPYEGETLKGWIDTVMVNGNIVFKDGRMN